MNSVTIEYQLDLYLIDFWTDSYHVFPPWSSGTKKQQFIHHFFFDSFTQVARVKTVLQTGPRRGKGTCTKSIVTGGIWKTFFGGSFSKTHYQPLSQLKLAIKKLVSNYGTEFCPDMPTQIFKEKKCRKFF